MLNVQIIIRLLVITFLHHHLELASQLQNLWTDLNIDIFTLLCFFLYLEVILSSSLEEGVHWSKNILTFGDTDKEPVVDGEDRLEPLGMGGVDHAPASDVLLEDGDQREDSLDGQPLDGVVYQVDIRSVEDAVQDPGVVAVEALHQQLGQRACPGGTRGPCGGGGQKRKSLLN